MATSDNVSKLIVGFFSVFYFTVFILSTVGNTWVLVTCYKTLKRRYYPFMWLLANLASADLSFTLLSLFNGIGFLWQWMGGNSTCKLQGFLLEASYTTSIITLVIISYQRLKVLTDPFNARIRAWSNREYTKLVIIWGSSLAVCSPLVYIYRVRMHENGEVACVTSTPRNIIVPQIYYSLHTIFFFVIPLLYMIFTQSRIFCALRTSVVPIRNSAFITKTNQRNRKASKTLAALTIAFVICWSPFMVTRTLLYFHLASPGLGWRASQLLIFLNTGLDPLLYGFYGGNLKSSLRKVMLSSTRCCQTAEAR